MIGLDTNSLVRYFLHDDAAQLKVVRARIDEGRRAGDTFYVNRIAFIGRAP